jgi:hypothetical protein
MKRSEKMKVWTMLLSLVVACLVAATAAAQGTVSKKLTLLERFEKMDANHDGILTAQEFAAAHPKLGAKKAVAFYNELAALGGTTTKGGVVGMNLPQFKKAHKLWKESHPKQGGPQPGTN